MGKCLIIIGMHRSGTSLVASLLQKAGLYIGDNLMPGSDGNEMGHYENMDFYQFHMKALESLSLHIDGWDLQRIEAPSEELSNEAEQILSRNNHHSEWGWKDPRTTLFMDFWNQKIPDPFYVFVYRNPWEVADSLYRRSSDSVFMLDPVHAFTTWDFYNREIIRMYSKVKERSVLIEVDDVIVDFNGFIQKINKQLGFSLQSSPETEKIFKGELYKENSRNHFRRLQTKLVFPQALITYNELRGLNGKQPVTINENEIQPKDVVDDWSLIGVLQKMHAGEVAYLQEEIRRRDSKFNWMKKLRLWKLREQWLKFKNWRQ